MPPEVLTEIFTLYGSLTPTVYVPPMRDLYPWRLGHVCSRWREILWNSPEIWSNIEIRNPHRVHEIRVEEILNEIFSHTSGLVSLCIFSFYYSPSRIRDLILPFIPRLKAISILFLATGLLRMLLELPSGSLNHLQRLDLDFHADESLPTTNPGLPNFRRLSIRGGTSIAPCLPHFAWPQLTHLSITEDMITPILIHFVLRQCRSLISVQFSINEEISDTMEY